FFASLTVVSAGYILFTKNILHAALALIVTLLSVAALYVFTAAEFVAVTQIMIYVGGIVVLIVFGVMLTNDVSGKSVSAGSINRVSGALITLAVLLLFIYGSRQFTSDGYPIYKVTSMDNLGKELLTTYLLPFEVAAVLLLVALVAASIVAGNNLKSNAL
ncbi:MAG: NADH-quinone oxidoreductase subunit J, partial [Bacteroidota bacterium]